MTAFATPQGPDSLPDSSINLHVVLLFENLRCGLRAKQAFDHLLSDLEIEATFRFEPVGFELLSDAAIGSNLARTAADADIVVVAPNGAELPGHVESWIREWTKGRTHSTAALVISLDASIGEDSGTANFLHDFMGVGSQPGISLIHHFAATPSIDSSASRLDISQLPGVKNSGIQGTLGRSESPRFRV